MHRFSFIFRVCLGISIVFVLLSFLYIRTPNQRAKGTTTSFKAFQQEQEENYSEARAVEVLKDTVGTIFNVPPKNAVFCPKFPDIFNLEINNDIWQVLETTNGTFYLFGAYADHRKKNIDGPSVRIIGMANRLDPTVETRCQFWYNDLESVEVPVTEYRLIWYRPWGLFESRTTLYPYLITCNLPETLKAYTPSAVSLVELPCELATNNLIVYNNYVPPKDKKDFVVCVKGLDFPFDDLSVRLIEWIELLRLLGADKVVFYNLDSHPNIGKVLDYYESNGTFVEVKPITLAGRQLNFGYYQHYYLKKQIIPKRFGELVAYNDCLYQNMQKFKYVVLLDIDEIILPILDKTWNDLIQRILQQTSNQTYSSFSTQNVYFLDTLQNEQVSFEGIPKQMHMLQHVVRTRNFTKPNYFAKCFHDTEEVLTLHNHFPLDCFTLSDHSCRYHVIENTMAQLNHYRADCKRISETSKNCQELKKNSVVDITLWTFKEVLVTRVEDVAGRLGLSFS